MKEYWRSEALPDLRSKVHSAIRFKDPRYVFLVDMQNFYKIDIITNETKTYHNQMCIGVFFSDENYLYTLCHKYESDKETEKQSGFKVYDIENVINLNEDFSYLLTKPQISCQGAIDYSKANARLVFLASYDRMEVVPVLHRNTVSYIGMGLRDSHLAARQV